MLSCWVIVKDHVDIAVVGSLGIRKDCKADATHWLKQVAMLYFAVKAERHVEVGKSTSMQAHYSGMSAFSQLSI